MLATLAASMATFGLLAQACGYDGPEVVFDQPADMPAPVPADHVVPFREFKDMAAHRTPEAARQLITTASAYRALVGGEPPADLDFRREWVVLYTAGTRMTGGFEAHIEGIQREGHGLTITTKLVVPGPDCMVTQALTHPYALARFPRQPDAPRVSFAHVDEVRSCAAEVHHPR
jgi:hypothetical protein